MQLLAQRPDLPVVFSSGYSVDFAAQDLNLEDGVNFMAKPFETSVLIATVRRRLDRRTE
jgi:FixJ family two-component response regulator